MCRLVAMETFDLHLKQTRLCETRTCCQNFDIQDRRGMAEAFIAYQKKFVMYKTLLENTGLFPG